MSRADEPVHEPVFPDDVVAGGEPGRRPLVRTVLTAVATVVVVLLLVAAYWVVSRMLTDTTTQASRVPLQSGQVEVDAGTADVRFVPGTGDALVIRAEVTHGPLDGSYRALIDKRENILVETGCRRLVSPGCRVRLTMEVPAGFPVEVTTTSGDVSAQDLADRVLTVRTTSGDVRGTGLKVTELSARTTSGDVDATFARAPFALKVRTEAGDVDAVLPRSDVRYAVQVRSGSGDVRNDLKDVRGGNGLVVVRTGAGDVSLRQR